MRFHSTAAASQSLSKSQAQQQHHQIEIHRLSHLRNVGVFAHVDAGKTTVTERMLALAGIVHHAGSVDTGTTVTDYLPAERERGITIQSAAISFTWRWFHCSDFHYVNLNSDNDNGDTIHKTNIGNGSNTKIDNEAEVTVHLIDTPGHVDFSVEVNRSVAVLDGAVLVVDAVAGVQAQTETVWKAMSKTATNVGTTAASKNDHHHHPNYGHGHGHGHGHEPLPCIGFVNKMDKEGCNFAYALSTLRDKLHGANPVAVQIPLFQTGSSSSTNSNNNSSSIIGENIVAVPTNDLTMEHVSNGRFVGVVDLINMRAVIWPDNDNNTHDPSAVSDVEKCVPDVINLSTNNDGDFDFTSNENLTEGERKSLSQIHNAALSSRADIVAALADVGDEAMEEYYLMEGNPSSAELRASLRRATLSREVLPVLTGAALRGKGVEPLLDAVADFLPSPMERLPPSLIDGGSSNRSRSNKKNDRQVEKKSNDEGNSAKIRFGHPLHPSLLALAFKVVHMKNKGSGDGRVVFARVYSGKLKSKDTLKVVTPSLAGELGGSEGGEQQSSTTEKVRTERVGAMLELAGGRFGTLKDGICLSGDVCALVGLKSVVTGDTLLLASDHETGTKGKKGKKNKAISEDDSVDMNIGENIYLAGVASPKPVLTVRVEAESAEQQAKLSEALALLNAEDPSLQVEETESVTLLSGLGELHIEVVVDRLKREFGLSVWIGKPAVAYRETINESIETSGLVEYDRTIGATKLQAAIHLRIEPISIPDVANNNSSSKLLSDPIVTIGSRAREYLGLDEDAPEEELSQASDLAHALIAGCKGALMRGPIGAYQFQNARCHVIDVESEGGLPYLTSLPGALRAAASSVLSSTLSENKSCCSMLEPTMRVEITAPTDMVGVVLSDLTSRRGSVGEVFMGDGVGQSSSMNSKALVHAEVPLIEILGYANTLRSLTGGEGTFSAEYVGHTPCDEV